MDTTQDSDSGLDEAPAQPIVPPPIAPNDANVLGSTEAEPAENRENPAERLADRTRTIELLQFVVNGALAVIGVFALYIYHGQLSVMQGQLNTAEWASYNACVSNQISRRSLMEVRKANAISQEMAVASAEEAAGEVDTEKSYIVFNARLPNAEEVSLNAPNFALVYSVKNDGKSTANHVHIGFSAILTRNDEVLKLDDKKLTGTWQSISFPPGASYPETPEIGRPITPVFPVIDNNGRNVPSNSEDVQKVLTDSAIIAVIGRIGYSDFAGTHEQRFCYPVYQMQAGTTRKSGIRPNEKTCFDYNRRQDNYSAFTTKPPSQATEAPLPEITCLPPNRR